MVANNFIQQRVVNLIANLDHYTDETTGINVMEACGRACARSGPITVAQQAQGDLAALLTTLRSWLGETNVTQDDHSVTVIYPRCLCEMARDIVDLPMTYCYCSQGWLKEMFETVVAHPVAVTIHETVKRGGPICRFTVTFTR
jgi:hypothetical protein